MYPKYEVVIFAPPSAALDLLEKFRAARIQEVFNEMCQTAFETGRVCPLTAEQVYDLEIHGCFYDFRNGAVDVTAISS